MGDLIELLATERDRMFHECREGLPRTYTTWTPELLHLAIDEIERLTAELERRKYDRVHTCHADCQREACVLRREVDALTAQLARDANPVCGTLGDSDGDDGA
jgi:uncharacterized small protein (DUF1192 family)